jgi:S1-C subfamily serine protease
VRIVDPYDTPPLSSDEVNTRARAAAVNIFCTGNDTLRPTSGSGVIIDPRGIILTNAHVAQYVLLSEDPRIDLSCQIRTGSPAYPHYIAEVLYMPPAWVETHSKDILSQHPLGTGENDYALLSIVGTTSGAPLPDTFPYVSPDTREAIGFTSDRVLAASYPAEFLGGMTAQMDLYQVSSFTNIGELLTFGDSTVDAFSLGGIIGAQSGSSGGAVVNAWGRLVGVVATMSDATTTAQRDLRAITLSYIDRDLAKHTSLGLAALLKTDLTARQETFNTETGPALVSQFITKMRH